MKNIYKRHRLPPPIIQYAVWLYYRFNVSYESIRFWINKFGPKFTRRLRRRHPGFGDTYFLDEVFVKVRGRQCCLSRVIDQHSDVVYVYVRARRDVKAAKGSSQRFL